MKSQALMLDLARAQERLHQAHDLARTAATLLAEIGVAQGIDLKAEIGFAVDARKSCWEALTRLDAQIAKTVVP